MKFRFLTPSLLAAVSQVLLAIVRASAVGGEASLLNISPLSSADVALDLRHDIAVAEKSDREAFVVIEREFLRDPRPHVKARFGEYLLNGKNWSAPENQEERGLALAQEALEAGSLHSLKALGWQSLVGRNVPKNVQLGSNYLQQGAEAGNLYAMITLGDAYFRGIGVDRNPVEAEKWFRRAADGGKPFNLSRLGEAYAEGSIGGARDLAKACALFYEADIRGSGNARKQLDALVKAGIPEAVRARRLVVLWFAALGADFQTKQVREAVEGLESAYPDDPQVLVALGRVQASGEFGFRDFRKAYTLFDHATKLGSLDARCQRARLIADGQGVARDRSAALAEWRELEALNHPETLSLLGYYHYWGARGDGVLPKDEKLAFAYSKRAADLGDFYGQKNTGLCYMYGIGVAENYAFAAHYLRAAAWRGSKVARTMLPRLLAHVK